MIQVQAKNPFLSKQPHFWEDDPVQKRGENLYELDLNHVVQELESKEPDIREAMNLLFGNSGYAIHWGSFDSGEREPAKLFKQTWDGCIKQKEDGTPYLAINLEAVALILLRNKDPQVKRLITDFLKNRMGLSPNMDRIREDYCPECQKKIAGAHP